LTGLRSNAEGEGHGCWRFVVGAPISIQGRHRGRSRVEMVGPEGAPALSKPCHSPQTWDEAFQLQLVFTSLINFLKSFSSIDYFYKSIDSQSLADTPVPILCILPLPLFSRVQGPPRPRPVRRFFLVWVSSSLRPASPAPRQPASARTSAYPYTPSPAQNAAQHT